MNMVGRTMKTKIDYSHVDYIVIRTDTFSNCGTDSTILSFDKMKLAEEWVRKDIDELVKSLGINKDDISTGSNYYCYENDDLVISWDIREIAHRTTSDWENPEHEVEWNKVS